MSNSNYVHISDVKIIEVREKALWIQYDGQRHWIPRFAIADNDTTDFTVGGGWSLSILERIAQEKKIEGED